MSITRIKIAVDIIKSHSAYLDFSENDFLSKFKMHRYLADGFFGEKSASKKRSMQQGMGMDGALVSDRKSSSVCR